MNFNSDNNRSIEPTNQNSNPNQHADTDNPRTTEQLSLQQVLQQQQQMQLQQQLQQQLQDQSEQLMQDQGNNAGQSNEKKGRRTRTDPNNRNYICGCGKSYLSYPALYTHIKQKHDGKQPEDTKKPEKTRGQRGRPTATGTSAQSANNFEQDNDNASTDSNDSLNVIEELVLYIFSALNKDVSVILQENSSNSLADMRAAFQGNIFEDSRDYSVIQDAMTEIFNNEGYIPDDQLDGADDDNNNGVVQTKCNLVFGLFIYSIGKHLKDYALKEIVFYCCLFRKALNEYGWKILQELGINVQQQYQQQQDYQDNNNSRNLPEFCETNSAQHVLELSNEFITDILPAYLTKYSAATSEFRLITLANLNTKIIKITQHFCSWLYAKKYTNSMLETNDDDYQQM